MDTDQLDFFADRMQANTVLYLDTNLRLIRDVAKAQGWTPKMIDMEAALVSALQLFPETVS